MFYLCKEAIPRMAAGSAIVNTASINSKSPSPNLLAYADDQGRHRQLHGRPGADGREARYPRELRSARPDLDAANPLD